MNVGKSLRHYGLHLAGLVAAFVFAGLAIRLLKALPGLPRDSARLVIDLYLPPSPVHVLCALLIGFALTRELRGREGRFVFILPALWFGVKFVSMIRPPESVLSQEWYYPTELFFSREPLASPQATVYYILLFTLPFLTGVAYSLGAILGFTIKAPGSRSAAADIGEQLEP